MIAIPYQLWENMSIISIYQDDVQDAECIIGNPGLAKRKRTGKRAEKVTVLKKLKIVKIYKINN